MCIFVGRTTDTVSGVIRILTICTPVFEMSWKRIGFIVPYVGRHNWHFTIHRTFIGRHNDVRQLLIQN